MTTADFRGTCLTATVGWSRSYLHQLDTARAELEELTADGHDDLSTLLESVKDAQQCVRAVDRIASRALKRQPAP